MGWLVLNGTETLITPRAVQEAKLGQLAAGADGSSHIECLYVCMYVCTCLYANAGTHTCESAMDFSLTRRIIIYLLDYSHDGMWDWAAAICTWSAYVSFVCTSDGCVCCMQGEFKLVLPYMHILTFIFTPSLASLWGSRAGEKGGGREAWMAGISPQVSR